MHVFPADNRNGLRWEVEDGKKVYRMNHLENHYTRDFRAYKSPEKARKIQLVGHALPSQDYKPKKYEEYRTPISYQGGDMSGDGISEAIHDLAIFKKIKKDISKGVELMKSFRVGSKPFTDALTSLLLKHKKPIGKLIVDYGLPALVLALAGVLSLPDSSSASLTAVLEKIIRVTTGGRARKAKCCAEKVKCSEMEGDGVFKDIKKEVKKDTKKVVKVVKESALFKKIKREIKKGLKEIESSNPEDVRKAIENLLIKYKKPLISLSLTVGIGALAFGIGTLSANPELIPIIDGVVRGLVKASTGYGLEEAVGGKNKRKRSQKQLEYDARRKQATKDKKDKKDEKVQLIDISDISSKEAPKPEPKKRAPRKKPDPKSVATSGKIVITGKKEIPMDEPLSHVCKQRKGIKVNDKWEKVGKITCKTRPIGAKRQLPDKLKRRNDVVRKLMNAESISWMQASKLVKSRNMDY